MIVDELGAVSRIDSSNIADTKRCAQSGGFARSMLD